MTAPGRNRLQDSAAGDEGLSLAMVMLMLCCMQQASVSALFIFAELVNLQMTCAVTLANRDRLS